MAKIDWRLSEEEYVEKCRSEYRQEKKKQDVRMLGARIRQRVNELINDDADKNTPDTFQVSQAVSTLVRSALGVNRMDFIGHDDLNRADEIAGRIISIIAGARTA